MSDVTPLAKAQNKANAEVVKRIEELLEEAKEGKLQGVLVFRFGLNPKTVGESVIGAVLETDAIYAVERWKHYFFADKD